ncbi:MAG: UvrD-helicase domain-containing protein [Halioglobus sp.]|nr:UvrD-helicase domain-containing protein [Halioglobus sp.]
MEGLVREHLAALHDVLAPYSSELLDLLVFADTNRGEVVMPDFPEAEPAQLAHWRRLRDMLLTGAGTWRKSITVKEGFPADKTGEAPRRKAQLKAILSDLADVPGLESLLADVTSCPRFAASNQVLGGCCRGLHLSRLLPVLAAQLLLVFRRRGVVDYSQLAQSALQALGEEAPTDLALRIDYSLEHILVDEFQDTSNDQYDLLGKLTRGWGEHNAQNPGAPRTLFIVSKSMQSILRLSREYRPVPVRARREGFNGVASSLSYQAILAARRGGMGQPHLCRGLSRAGGYRRGGRLQSRHRDA